MKKLIGIFAALTLWSTVSFASLPPADQSDSFSTISQWTQHLNSYYTTLELRANTSNPSNYGQVLVELDLLEKHLQGDVILKDGSLIQLACLECVCNGCKKKKKD